MLDDERTFIQNFVAPNRRERWLSKGISHLGCSYDIQFHVDETKCFPLTHTKWSVIASWWSEQTSFGVGRVAFGSGTELREVNLADIECLSELRYFDGLILFRGGRIALLRGEPGVEELIFVADPAELRRLYESYEKFCRQHRK